MEDSEKRKEYNLNLYLAENRNGMSTLYDELSKGDIIKFGRYPQKESEIQDIEWYVLNKENGQVLLQSKNILDFSCPEVIGCDWGAFSEGWANNPLRFWLNTKFLSNAFSDNEKPLIKTTYVHADPKIKSDRNKTYHIDKKNIVSDSVYSDPLFVIDMRELEKENPSLGHYVYVRNAVTREIEYTLIPGKTYGNTYVVRGSSQYGEIEYTINDEFICKGEDNLNHNIMYRVREGSSSDRKIVERYQL